METIQNTDIAKVKAVILYIIGKVGKVDFHKLFKILYFAERDHLVMYGRKIVNDNYTAMDDGPVPSFIYDIFKKNSNTLTAEHINYFQSLEVHSYFVSSSESPDMDELSQSDISCLDKSIAEYKCMGKTELTNLSHKFAYDKARAINPKRKNNPIDITDIALEGGASPEMINYINETSFILSCV